MPPACGRFELRCAVLSCDALECERETVRVLNASAHVVVVLGEAGRAPGVTIADQVLSDRWVADVDSGPCAAVAVGVHHQHAIPVLGHFHTISGAIQHTPPAIGFRGACHSTERKTGGIWRELAAVLRARFLGLWLGAASSACGQCEGTQQGHGGGPAAARDSECHSVSLLIDDFVN